MLADVGYYSLIAAFALCFYSIVTSVLGAKMRRPNFIESGERAVVGVVFLIFFASGLLIHALVTSNFGVEYVAHYTSSTLSPGYKVTAFWGGQAGSLLFWLLILSVYTVVVLLQNQNKNRQMMPYVTSVLMGITLFFLSMVLFAANPFRKVIPIPVEGQGLNPLLQNYWMASHPPSLYIGYIGVAVPYAFAMAALLTGKLDTGWIKATRKWTLFSWLFLTCGILMGSYWAYIELGWGGYWAWDPVENASLMPWLAATAFLHSIMVTEKKGMLKTWNIVLVMLAFTLSIFGTFLTRSGVVSSVHSFAQSPIGMFFAVFLSIQIGFSVFLLIHRKKELAPEAKLESFISRESSFLFNNIFFLVICLAVLSGTTFPIVSEWVTGKKVTVSAPFFNNVVTPFAIGLLLLTGICPLIAWRKASTKNLQRNFIMPAAAGLFSVALLIVFGIYNWKALLFFFSCVFVLATVYLEFSRGTQARIAMMHEKAPEAFYNLVSRNKRRYGGFIIHTGMAVLFIGIAASSFYSLEKEATIKPKESFTARSYKITYDELKYQQDSHKEVIWATLQVEKNGKPAGYLLPERHFYKSSDQPTTEVAIKSFWNEDLYILLAGWDEAGTATFKVYVNPLIGWLWWGGFIAALGGLIVLLPDFKPQYVLSRAKEDLAAQES